MTQAQRTSTEAGSIVELEAIYREQYSRFLRFAVANLGDIEHGRDAVHEAFVRAFRSIGDFRGQARLESWLWRILVNVCVAEKRRRVVPTEDVLAGKRRWLSRVARDSGSDCRSAGAPEDHSLSSSLRRPRLRPDRGSTWRRPRNRCGNPERSAHETPICPWRGEEMTDYLSSVLDELVPEFPTRMAIGRAWSRAPALRPPR